jgi:hypothetical protein
MAFPTIGFYKEPSIEHVIARFLCKGVRLRYRKALAQAQEPDHKN